MANAVFTTRVNPSYDDLPEFHYHFPKTYLRQAEAALGDWIVYYEPRRSEANDSGAEGRQCYFAAARVTSVDSDPKLANHYYAFVTDYIDFPTPVPFREGAHYYEAILRKADGTTSKGAFGRAVRGLPSEEYHAIVAAGFATTLNLSADSVEFVDDAGAIVVPAADEVPEAFRHPVIQQVVNRKLRDAAFARIVRDAYNSTCSFTGLRLINGGSRCEIEAVHIRPVRADGPDSVRNGLALSRTFHWMFDRGIVSLEDDGRIIMAEKLVPETVRRMMNPDRYALLPAAAHTRPHGQFLKYHRDKVFKG